MLDTRRRKRTKKGKGEEDGAREKGVEEIIEEGREER